MATLTAMHVAPRPLRHSRRLLAEPPLVPQFDTCSIVDNGFSSGSGSPAAHAVGEQTAARGTAAATTSTEQPQPQPKLPPTGTTAVGDPNLGPSLSPASDASALQVPPPQQQQWQLQAALPFGYASPALRGLLPGGSGSAPSRHLPQHGVPPLQPPDGAVLSDPHQLHRHEQQQQQQQHLAADGAAGAAPSLEQVQRWLHLQHPPDLRTRGGREAACLSEEDERYCNRFGPSNVL